MPEPTSRPLPRRLRITGGGGAFDTTLHDADTGEDLTSHVTAVYWQHRAGEPPRAVVTCLAPALDVVAPLACRHCGRLQTEDHHV